MLYPLAWLPAEAAQSPDIHSVDAHIPSVGQREAKWSRLGQRLRPQLAPHSQITNRRPFLSGTLPRTQQTSQRMAVGEGEKLELNVEATALKFGDRGQTVKLLQTHLQKLGYYGSALDGIFGPLTEAGVRSFQQDQSLLVDGVVGPLTWQRLENSLKSISVGNVSQNNARPVNLKSPTKPAPSSVPVAHTFATSQQPFFTPGLVPILEFHPLEVAPSQGNSKVIWVIVLTLAASGGVAFYFKPDKASQSVRAIPKRSQIKGTTVHHPQPLYPKVRQPTRAQVVHCPQPVYPPSYQHSSVPHAEESEAEATSKTFTSEQATEATSAESSQTDTRQADHTRASDLANAQLKTLETTLQQRPQNIPWAKQSTETYLTSFLYDLQEADSRQQLEGLVAILPAAETTVAEQTHSAASTLLKRLGTFPERNRRTNTPYTYLLLDDMAGCFRLIKNELWLTETALVWLNDDDPYTLNIRRIEANGRTIDKEFTVKLNSLQLQLAS